MLKTRNLEAYYRFEGNANDSSGNGNNGTVSGAVLSPTIVAPKFGNRCLFWNGRTAISLLGAVYNLGANFSFSFWYRWTSGLGSSRMLIHSRQDGGVNRTGVMINSEGTLIFISYAGGGTYQEDTIASSTTADVWHHCIVTRASSVMNAWVDGTKVVTNASVEGGDITSSNNWAIGGRNDNVSLRAYKGNIAQIGMWSKVLSSGEISDLWNSGDGMEWSDVDAHSTLKTSLRGYWECKRDMDADTGPNGTMGGIVMLPKFGRAYDFDGVDDYIDLGSNAIISGTEFTVSAWANISGIGGGSQNLNPIFSHRKDTVGNDQPVILLLAEFTQQEESLFQIRSSSGSVQNVVVSGPQRGVWTHYAGVVTSTHIYFYINGQLVGSDTNNQTGTYTDINYVDIGRVRYSGTNVGFFNGIIDEPMVFSRALSATDIKRLMMGMHPIN